jgi:hypothetical protein
MEISECIKKQFLLFNNYNKTNIDFVINNSIMIYDNIDLINFNEFVEILNYDDIIWDFDINNYKIPYYKNIKIKFLYIKNNIYDLISSNSLLPDDQIICGENIQNICDVVIGTHEKIISNKNNIEYSKKIENIQNLNNISCYKNIFVFTDNLLEFYNKYKNELNCKNIISHNSDYEINEDYTDFINNVNYQFSQNVLINHPKLKAIPIGIENRQYFDHNIFHNIRKRNDIKKEKNIYFLFSLTTHASRIDCYNILKDKLCFSNKVPKEEYFIELKKHKYAICPRGNGIDTHRIWECLYLDVIPIIITKDFINIDNLPIIILNSWADLNENNLSNKFKQLKTSKITMSYYKNIII